MSKISAVIITFNEERNIARCLESVKEVADEVLVVDSHSHDGTAGICREMGARVIDTDWMGYAATKNFGNQLAQHDYILSIDADEVLSRELIRSIQTAKQQLQGCYRVNRITNYCGRWVRHSGWYPDHKIRLFDRRSAQWHGEVHETLVMEKLGEPQFLAGDLLHFSFNSPADHVQRVNRYSNLAARACSQKSAAELYLRMLLAPPITLLKIYLLRRGFLDGYAGLCIAVISAFDQFIRHAKALHLKHERVADESSG